MFTEASEEMLQYECVQYMYIPNTPNARPPKAIPMA